MMDEFLMSNPILIIDGHLDMAFNALYKRRDLTQPVQVLRERDLPSSIEVISDSDSGDTLIYVPPSGLLRQESISLRSRLGISEVTFE